MAIPGTMGSAATSDQAESAALGGEERLWLSARLLEGAEAKASIAGEGLVLQSDVLSDRLGRAYVVLGVRCADGSAIEARWWRFPYRASEAPAVGTVWRFSGRVDQFNGSRQLCVVDGRLVADADLSAYAKAARKPLAELEAGLNERLEEIERLDAWLGALARKVLTGDVGERFRAWPASQRHHGAVRRGLLAHSLGVADVAERLMGCYGNDSLACDWALVLTGALLHDVGKVWTLPAIAGAPLPMQAEQMDHVTMGAVMVQAAAGQLPVVPTHERLDALLHVVVAHHGRKEWGAAVEPRTVEAWIVHLADYAESRLWPYAEQEEG
jgi:3'-5' exoribonuclease